MPTPPTRRAAVIQHVAFEDLGTLQPALQAAGFHIEILQAGVADLSALRQRPPELLVVLGGPVGVYDRDTYPFLDEERELLAQRLQRGQHILGICLGAQLMAAALGARVYAGAHGQEIGWSALAPASAAARAGVLAPLFEPGIQVLHWHGDTFDLPTDAVRLAGTDRYPSQAFAVGTHGLALQFHAEVETAPLERWYIGHAAQLSQVGIAVPALRAQSRLHGPALERSAAALWRTWLRTIIAP